MTDTKVKYTVNHGDDPVRIADGKKGTRGSKDRISITMFDRCEGTLFNLHFNAPSMERLYLDCSFPLSRHLFRFAMIYFMLIGFAWIIFFPLRGGDFVGYVVGAAIVIILAAIMIGISFTEFFRKQYLWISLTISIVVGIIFLLSFVVTPPSASVVFNLALIVQLILTMYTLIPIRLWMALALGTCFTVSYEILASLHYGCDNWRFIVSTILLNFAVHMVGFIIHIMAQVCRRSTFLRLCQSAQFQKDIELEQKSKADFIRSLMPDKVANDVMQECENMGSPAGVGEDDEEDSVDRDHSEAKEEEHAAEVDSDLESGTHQEVAKNGMVTFRKFHVSQMSNVSILFADIVGFTKMSSNKTATQLVTLLNDLFGRFDKLCEMTKCEKIATLGDCYYCVSGCPNSVEDHAVRCVEMGRAMCTAIQQFDEDFEQEVNMRVGVHTGMVICGIVGTRRFKFDVWSNDVTLANEMESSGEPGLVHISECTLEFVKDIYEVREGKPVVDIRKIKVLIEFFDEKLKCYAIKHRQDETDIKTYFIEGRKDNQPIVELERIKVHKMEELVEHAVAEETVDTTKIALTEPLTETADRGKDDATLVEMMRANQKPEDVFYFPPISPITLNFNDPKLETVYRNLLLKKPTRGKLALTWATPRITAMISGVTTLFYVLLILVACILGFGYGGQYYPSCSIFFCVAIVVSIALLLLFVTPLIVDVSQWTTAPKRFLQFYRNLFSWYPRNILGAFVMFTPALLVLSNFRCCLFSPDDNHGYQTITGVMHLFMVINFTLFTMFSSWTKSIMATLAVIFSLLLIYGSQLFTAGCPQGDPFARYLDPDWVNTTLDSSVDARELWARGWAYMEYEMTAMLLLTLVLVWFLNRDFDIRFRMSCECDHRARVEKDKISREKRQADWLLENIIPKYISETVKTEKKYSQHVEQVGVIFATIANFDEFYDEQYEGGKEMLRVLNEIFADFENLLGLQKYKDVEKIKSIGACFMAASGLNTVQRARNKKPKAHLFQLMDFCVDVLKTIEEFNQQIFNFDFELKIGYNIGDVTAGVIGSTKLLYDIWGDTVNVSSRMYSTGSKGRIQVTKAVADLLSERYEFEYRGDVTVKGKGIMQTYLLVKKKTDSTKG